MDIFYYYSKLNYKTSLYFILSYVMSKNSYYAFKFIMKNYHSYCKKKLYLQFAINVPSSLCVIKLTWILTLWLFYFLLKFRLTNKMHLLFWIFYLWLSENKIPAIMKILVMLILNLKIKNFIERKRMKFDFFKWSCQNCDY